MNVTGSVQKTIYNFRSNNHKITGENKGIPNYSLGTTYFKQTDYHVNITFLLMQFFCAHEVKVAHHCPALLFLYLGKYIYTDVHKALGE